MSEELTIRYVPLAQVRRWSRNPKKHDIGAIVESIRRYGMIDPPKYDATLDALLYGNGRDEALEWMQAQGDEPPRGIKVDGDTWLVPIKFGVDAVSVEEAEAAAIDHNNLTMSGGDYSPFDMTRMWGEGYTDVLAELGRSQALPITVDGDVLDALLAPPLDPSQLWKGMPEFEQEDKTAWKSVIVHFANEQDYEEFARIINQTLTMQTKSIWHPYRAKENFKDVYYETNGT